MKTVCQNYYFLIFILPFLFSCHTSHYYLVRHAEKVDSSRDPDLSIAGQKRADALKSRLQTAGIDLLYATPYKRTQQTLQPLADALQKEVMIYEAGKTFELVGQLKKKRNMDVVVAGHSNTVPELVYHFTGDSVYIDHHEYHYLFYIQKRKNIFATKYRLEELEYGN